MKYETLTNSASGSYSNGNTISLTFTFNNNIDSIRCIYYHNANQPYIRLTSQSVADNVLTLTFTYTYTSTTTSYIFAMVTAAAY